MSERIVELMIDIANEEFRRKRRRKVRSGAGLRTLRNQLPPTSDLRVFFSVGSNILQGGDVSPSASGLRVHDRGKGPRSLDRPSKNR